MQRCGPCANPIRHANKFTLTLARGVNYFRSFWRKIHPVTRIPWWKLGQACIFGIMQTALFAKITSNTLFLSLILVLPIWSIRSCRH